VNEISDEAVAVGSAVNTSIVKTMITTVFALNRSPLIGAWTDHH